MKRHFRGVFLIPLVLLLSLFGVMACSDSPGQGRPSLTSGAIERPQDTAAIPVTVAKAMRSTVPIELSAIGTGQAFKTVSVESQIAGVVKDVLYRPGQFVKQGDLLVRLDNRPFEAALAQAQANLERDKANAQLNVVNEDRNKKLLDEGIIPQQQYDQAVATAVSSQAVVAADEAAIQTAKIQLSYCSIYAPISGVTGAQLVFPGTAVKAEDLPVLVVINQISPIFVTFSVPQQFLPAIKTSMAHSALPVQTTPPGATAAENGVLTFVNNTIDNTTGTIELMGTFANSDRRLWPGQFSNVVLRLGEQQNILVVPSPAVQAGQQGDYVFVVKPDMTVAVRQVKAGQSVNNLTEILQGLSGGETVVTDGQVRLVPGSKVYFTKGIT